MTDVLLATCAHLPDGEPGGHLIVEALADLGLSAAWAVWDDPAVDWSSPRAVAVRSTWDYVSRRKEFLAWAAHVERWTTLFNGAAAFAWNTDKHYLVDLAEAGVPVVPTRPLLRAQDLPAVAQGMRGRVLVKPRVAVGGAGIVVLDGRPDAADLLGLVSGAEADLGVGPWLVQPVVESVRTEGETSVFVLDGLCASQVRKLPAGSELRVHEEYGGRNERVPLGAEAATLAVDAVAAAEECLRRDDPDVDLVYARVDLLRLPDGRLVVSEVEVTEPGLYLEDVPENARRFAEAVGETLIRRAADGET